jgi:hypothetical protein
MKTIGKRREEWMMFIVVEHGVFIWVRGGSNRFVTCFDMSVKQERN